MTPWTKLEGTPLWDAASLQYAENGHDYHDMSHVGRLYGHAARFRLPYDPSLDRAILAHDVILDLAGGNEARSAVWLRDQLGEEDRVATRLIMTTVDHDPQHSDRRLALLDLGDFLDPERSRLNTRLLRLEAAQMRGDRFDEAVWEEGIVLYLGGLSRRIRDGLDQGPTGPERRVWSKILAGITRVIREIEAGPVPDRDPEPA
jgi:predicted metal-dependent HD superfamily phosphohydrolase